MTGGAWGVATSCDKEQPPQDKVADLGPVGRARGGGCVFFGDPDPRRAAAGYNSRPSTTGSDRRG
jgi:hypothetical protein